MALKHSTDNESEVFLAEIPQIEFKSFIVDITGDTPLIVHKWAEKARKEMLDKQMKKASTGKDAKNPVRDFLDSIYFIDDAGNGIPTPPELRNVTPRTPYEKIEDVLKKSRFGLPTCAFKKCAIDAGYQQGALKTKTTAWGAFFIVGEFAVIDGFPTMREDMVKISKGTPDIRYRAEFKQWKTQRPDQIIALLTLGGSSVGIGEWRPEHHGPFGTYRCV